MAFFSNALSVLEILFLISPGVNLGKFFDSDFVSFNEKSISPILKTLPASALRVSSIPARVAIEPWSVSRSPDLFNFSAYSKTYCPCLSDCPLNGASPNFETLVTPLDFVTVSVSLIQASALSLESGLM